MLSKQRLYPPRMFAWSDNTAHARLYAAGNMFWGGQAIRLRLETEVAVPLGFAMRWLASLTARGGVYYPYSDTVAVSDPYVINPCMCMQAMCDPCPGRVLNFGYEFS